MAFPLTAVFDLGAKLIDRLIPNPEAKATAQLELMRLQQSGDLAQLAAETDLAKGQQAINLAEASNANVFVSGWRPAIGWVCALALFANFLGVPILAWVSGIAGWPAPPRLELFELLQLMAGMLGLSAIRSGERKAGVA